MERDGERYGRCCCALCVLADVHLWTLNAAGKVKSFQHAIDTAGMKWIHGV